MGIDGISLFFVLLSTFLTPICVVASWTAVKVRVKEYMIAFLVLETLMVGMFCALDFFVFYMFFEGVLIPMFLIIGVWGGPRRVYAAFKFFLYTLLGSVLMLLAILADLFPGRLDRHRRGADLQLRPGAADLAVARLLRLLRGEGADVAGPYLAARRACRGADRGLGHPRRRALEDGRLWLHPLLAADAAGRLGLFHAVRLHAFSVVAIIYTSLVALAQEDMKKLIAYSSVAHMGFVTMGIFTVTSEGLQGAMIQMLSHGVVSAALFLVRRRRL